jgi:hypothetical protein
MKRAALIAIVTVAALIILVYSPFILSSARFQWTTRKWESQIKRKEDPEKLRMWAKGLLERYTNNPFDKSIETNFPPIGVGIHHEFTSIYYAEADTNGKAKLNPTTDFVEVACDFGAWTGMWGIKIGETNFVLTNSVAWKPGIYFFRFGGD